MALPLQTLSPSNEQMSPTLTRSQLDKLGNTMIYLANNVGEFGITKALKLLFLIEESSIKKYGIPFFGFEFKVWQFGPVVEPVYNELNEKSLNILAKYVTKISYGDEFLFKSVDEFNDDEFSNNDLLTLTEIIAFARHKTAVDFVKITHGDGSLWKTTALEYGVLAELESKKLYTTDIVINFSSLVKNNEYLKFRYEDHIDFLKFNQYLNA